ncbi:ABC transporter ATP-binding protein [Psychromarinibacter sp. C21-152]|uniref:ABC transporter ATP-binding protein n=1 Tax=Psychromarinibacter sediminicola TaxID=3033385 RepID=A0AAE3NNM8_9RHOB|nr:ABC transporter ATP-binding protein [Psychromarinibacter sediminicola]MDF0599629.1 ABC transporter ATP-binding protein [Psychromarinibacter sediminicola]
MADTPLLKVEDLCTHYHLPQGTVRAVDGASLSVKPGQTVGIVGESGCGKSVMLRSILRIVPRPGRIESGRILYARADGQVTDLAALDQDGRAARAIRGAEISMIFQEPMTSLSPVHTIGDQIGEALILHRDLSRKAARAETVAALDRVAMPRAERIVDMYPHEISGGMRQRAMIAMALCCGPRLLMADEPTTALDVTTQAQILALMRRLQEEDGMAIVFVTHDLGVVAQMTEFVVIMYLGRVVETGPVRDIYYRPKHPYTHALLHSIPKLGQRRAGARLQSVKGGLPDPYLTMTGCPFAPRCPHNDGDRCEREAPALRSVGAAQEVRCHYAERLDLQGVRKAVTA